MWSKLKNKMCLLLPLLRWLVVRLLESLLSLGIRGLMLLFLLRLVAWLFIALISSAISLLGLSCEDS